MNVRHLAWSVCLLALASAPRTTTAIDPALLAYQHTAWLVLDADLRLHLCHLKEFSLHLSRHPSEDVHSMGNAGPEWTPDSPLTQGHSGGNQHLNDVLLCRQEAEEALKSRLLRADQELSAKPAAQEKLKAFAALWLSAIKTIPRPVLGKDALLEQQDHDRRAIMQTQSQLEVELYRSYDHPHGWVSGRPPRN